MINVTDFIFLFLIFLRISAAFISSPIFGSKFIPVTIKLFLALIISYIIFLYVDKSVLQDVPTGWMLLIFSAKEVITGLIIGFMLQIIFYAVNYAGTLVGFNMGLTMAEVFNPSEGINSNVIGELFYYSTILIFLLINGHHYLIEALKYSFSVLNLGSISFEQPLFETIIQLTSVMFVIAVKISSPILVSFFLINIAEGIVSRMIPQMQIFFVTQPLKIGIGLVLLAAISPAFVYVIKGLLQDYQNKLYLLINSMV